MNTYSIHSFVYSMTKNKINRITFEVKYQLKIEKVN